jgi:thiamine-monophosphate kinase
MVEGVHFLPGDPPRDVAAKLLRVNLSDLAAMAATPLCYTLTTVLPHRIDDTWLRAFAGGLAEDQARFGIRLAGGDSVTTEGPVMVSVTALGTVAAGQALTRRAPGSGVLCVTGTIGDAALGLALVQGRLKPPPGFGVHADFLTQRLRRPLPRLDAVPLLQAYALAGLDVSDGLVADLGHLCAVSGLDGILDARLVPLSPAATVALGQDPALVETVLTGGDDYEIAFAVAADRVDALMAEAAAVGVAVTAIGHLTGPGRKGSGDLAVIGPDGEILPLSRRGWTHF